MKKFTFLVALIMIIASMHTSVKAQWNITGSDIYNSNAGNVGVGTAGATSASSILEARSTTKGVLIPRMTKAQRDAIVSPATGLLIFQTNSTPGFYYYGGTAWTAVSPKGVNKTLSNLTGPTAVNVDLLPGTANTLDLGSSTYSWKNINIVGDINRLGQRFLSISGTGNAFFGINSGITNTASFNTFLGYQAGLSNTTGTENFFAGFNAGNANSTGNYNSFAGSAVGRSKTTGTL